MRYTPLRHEAVSAMKLFAFRHKTVRTGFPRCLCRAGTFIIPSGSLPSGIGIGQRIMLKINKYIM